MARKKSDVLAGSDATAKKKSTHVLYCSFCGLSQHDVRKLIAGPTVFICDVCVSTCIDMVEQPNETVTDDGKKTVSVSITFDPDLSDLEMELLPELVKSVSGFFPSYEISIRSFRRSLDATTVVNLSVIVPKDIPKDTLSERLNEVSTKLRIEQQRYLSEARQRKVVEEKLRDLKVEMFDFLAAEVRKTTPWSPIERVPMLVFFFDLVGFSKFEEAEREKILAFLRSISSFMFKSTDSVHLNMWGDGIICAFTDINQGMRCACNFISHLNIYGYEVRGGGSWGTVRLAFNEATERRDLDGDSVNFGARLETIADSGELLVSEEVFHHPDLDKDSFLFLDCKRKLIKGAGKAQAGDEIQAYSAKLRKNYSSIEK